MHVVCMASARHAQIYKDGLASKRESFMYGGRGARELMNKFFEISHRPVRTISYADLHYPNQFPEVFSTAGDKTRTLSPGVWLIFEGGNWRYPPIRKGFERQVPHGRLITEAVRPAVFFIHVDPDWHGTLRENVQDWMNSGEVFREANLRERNAGIGWIPYKGMFADQIKRTSEMVHLAQDRFEDNTRPSDTSRDSFTTRTGIIGTRESSPKTIGWTPTAAGRTASQPSSGMWTRPLVEVTLGSRRSITTRWVPTSITTPVTTRA